MSILTNIPETDAPVVINMYGTMYLILSITTMIWITGANGQLGKCFQDILTPNEAIFTGSEVDIAQIDQLQSFVENSPQINYIINCAAYTAVDLAEEESDQAYLVNQTGAENLAKIAKELEIPIVHISTDYVFDGSNYIPYTEIDSPNPQSIYGKSKLAGEKAILETRATSIIIRTSWLYSEYGKNFLLTMLKLGTERDSLTVVNDQIGTPTYAKDLAHAIIALLPNIIPGTQEIYHYSNNGVCSWYDFSYTIMQEAGLACAITPIPSTEYVFKTPRPYYSVLNKAKLQAILPDTIPHWTESLSRCLDTISKAQG